MDSVSREKRSQIMAAVKGKNTKPEILIRKILHNEGYRFRIHRKDLPGKPDIVLPKYKVAIFVHGCFWHRHKACKKATTPTSNTQFWSDKFLQNIQRDKQNQRALKKLGWKVVVIWECQCKDKETLICHLEKSLKKPN